MLNVHPIGYVANSALELTDQNWSAVESEIRLLPKFRKGLQGLETFSHAMIVYWMHRSDFSAARDLLRRPREREDWPEVGIFSQRAKHRPNPIGITAVTVVRVERGSLFVRGLDAVDETPVLDIKPYVPHFDRVDNPRTPSWIMELMKDYF